MAPKIILELIKGGCGEEEGDNTSIWGGPKKLPGEAVLNWDIKKEFGLKMKRLRHEIRVGK